METNKTTKKKMNILDLIVLLILIVAVLFGVFWLVGGFDEKEKEINETVLFRVEMRGEEAELLNYISEGDKAYDPTTGEEIGVLKTVHEGTAQIMVENHEAKTVEYAEIPDLIDVVFEIEGKAKMEYPNIIVGSDSLKIGKVFRCSVGEAEISGTVIGIDYDANMLEKKEKEK